MMTQLSYKSLNPKFSPDTENLCPCCGELSLERAFQPAIVPTKQGYWQTHCMKPGCPMRGRTLSIADFMAEAKMKASKSNE